MPSWMKAYDPLPDIQNQGYNTPDNYKIKIYSTGGDAGSNDVIIGNLPESFSLSSGSTWNNPYGDKSALDLITGALRQNSSASDNAQTSAAKAAHNRSLDVAGKGIDAFAQATGFTNQIKAQTVSVWTAGQPLSLELPLVLRAFDDAVTDVTDKIVRLMRMTAPKTELGVLVAPGPSVIGKGEIITVELGKFIRISPVIVEVVSTEIVSQFDISGNPIAATLNISIKTPYVLTKEDISSFFVSSSGSKGGGTQSGF